MSAWDKALLCGIYTISPLHVGTGQAEGAIDLPVAKEPHTGFPVIPASSLKGVARAAVTESLGQGDEAKKQLTQWFGPKEGELSAGDLVFTEGRLVAFSARSLNRPFLYVTSRLILERLARDLRAAGIQALGSLSLTSSPAEVLVAEKALAKSLVLEDLAYSENIAHSLELAAIGESLAKMLPAEESETRKRLANSLVLIPDNDFSALVSRLPVRARIRLDENKTTSGKDGNLWYEEQVPADCLFLSMVADRKKNSVSLKEFRAARSALAVTQIGGNETVGEGLCLWTVGEAEAGTVGAQAVPAGNRKAAR